MENDPFENDSFEDDELLKLTEKVERKNLENEEPTSMQEDMILTEEELLSVDGRLKPHSSKDLFITEEEWMIKLHEECEKKQEEEWVNNNEDYLLMNPEEELEKHDEEWLLKQEEECLLEKEEDGDTDHKIISIVTR